MAAFGGKIPYVIWEMVTQVKLSFADAGKRIIITLKIDFCGCRLPKLEQNTQNTFMA